MKQKEQNGGKENRYVESGNITRETEKYKKEQAEKSVQITFHADRRLDFNQQKFYCGGYLFLQYIYYGLQLDKTCRKIRDKYDFKFDINAILSDLVYSPLQTIKTFRYAS